MAELDPSVERFLDEQPVGTLATLRPDGRARHTLVYFVREGDVVRISTEGKRGKARDVERAGRASFCVMGHEKPWPSLTIEGSARIAREDIGASTAKILGRITDNEPSPPPTDEQLAKADRVILEVAIDRVYGVSYVD